MHFLLPWTLLVRTILPLSQKTWPWAIGRGKSWGGGGGGALIR